MAASLTYDTESVSVWLDRAEAGGEMAQQVCAAHAANLTVPLGWTVTDRRLAPVGSAGPLAPEPAPPAEDAGTEDGPDGTSAGTGAPEAGVPEAEVRPAGGGRSGEAAGRVPEGEAPRPARRKPKGLLDRAFEWTGPQHSVLTTGSPAGADDGDRPDE